MDKSPNMSSSLNFTFHFLPVEDRLACVFSGQDQDVPTLLLTRRLVKMLCTNLRGVVEASSGASAGLTAPEKDKVMAFAHEAFLQDRGVEHKPSEQTQQIHLKHPVLPTRIDIQHSENGSVISFYKQDTRLIRLRMGQDMLQKVYHALGAMNTKAGWDLDELFGFRDESNDSRQDQPSYVC